MPIQSTANQDAAKLIAEMKVMVKDNPAALKELSKKEARYLQLQQKAAKQCLVNAKSYNKLQQMDGSAFKAYAKQTFGEETQSTIEQLQNQNVSLDDMKAVLSTSGAPQTPKTPVVDSSGGDAFDVSFPNISVLPLWQVTLLAANPATTALFGPVAPFKLLAKATGHSFGLGINGSAGAGGGFTLGGGLVYLPNGDIGIYGGVSVNIGFFASISGTIAVTHVFGGINSFSGSAIGIFAGGGELIVGQGTILFATSLPVKVLGYVIEVGIGAGLSPFEVGANLGATGVIRQDQIDYFTELIRKKIGG